MAKSNLESFVAQFVAVVKGDAAAVLAEKVYRQRKSALESHVASLKGDKVDAEQSITDAKANLVKARFNNGELIGDKEGRAKYIETLVKANDAVIDAEEELESLTLTIDFLEKESTYTFEDVVLEE